MGIRPEQLFWKKVLSPLYVVLGSFNSPMSWGVRVAKVLPDGHIESGKRCISLNFKPLPGFLSLVEKIVEGFDDERFAHD
jgi:hypothetical protein